MVSTLCNSFKINVDGSFLGNPRKANTGVLIRDSNGVWLKGFSGMLVSLLIWWLS